MTKIKNASRGASRLNLFITTVLFVSFAPVIWAQSALPNAEDVRKEIDQTADETESRTESQPEPRQNQDSRPKPPVSETTSDDMEEVPIVEPESLEALNPTTHPILIEHPQEKKGLRRI